MNLTKINVDGVEIVVELYVSITVGKDYMAKKVDERRGKLLEILQERNCSIPELVEILNASRRTIESDIKAFRDSDIEIEVKKDIVHLIKYASVVKKSSCSIVRQTKILMLLGNATDGMTKEEIVKEMKLAFRDEIKDEKRLDDIGDALRKRVDSDLKELIRQKKIFCTEQKNPNYFLSLNSDIQMTFDEVGLESVYKELVNHCDINSYGDILFQITQKIYTAVDNKIYGDKIERIEPLVLQNQKNEYKKYESILNMLFTFNYKKKKIIVDYVDRYGLSTNKEIGIGAIILLTSVGKFYLLGKEKIKDAYDRFVLIELSRIEKIQESEDENKEFGDEKYKRICDEMYKISIEKAMDVVYKYENTSENREWVKRQMKIRGALSSEYSNGFIICKDTIRGKDDFCKFIRGEGNNVFVVSPPGIVSTMKASAERILERYANEE